MVNESERLDVVFAALADPTRRHILERLARGPLSVGEIAADFDISQPAISKHVKVLERSGLLSRRIEGRVHYCTLDPRAMQRAVGWIDAQRRFWNATLDRLDSLLTTSPKRKKHT